MPRVLGACMAGSDTSAASSGQNDTPLVGVQAVRSPHVLKLACYSKDDPAKNVVESVSGFVCVFGREPARCACVCVGG